MVVADYELSGRSDSTERYRADLTSAFKAPHPDIDVTVDVVSWNDVDRKVAEMSRDGNPPDIAQLGSYVHFADCGELYAADDLLSIPVQAGFVQTLARVCEYQRTQYGLPFVASTRLLFHNKKLLAEAGVKRPTTTWAQLKDAAEQVKNRTDARYPVALPLGPEEAQVEAMAWMLGTDGGYTASNGSYRIDSEQNVAMLTWLKENLVQPGLTGPVPPGRLDRKDAYSTFVKGDVAMVNGRPSLLGAARQASVDVGLVPVPGREDSAVSAPCMVDWVSAFKHNGNRGEIGRFLDFVYADENVRTFAARNNEHFRSTLGRVKIAFA
ncbi:extracellular solute-binding protein [Streptomyces sp. HNM0663]|uniref:Extracellular solute-binding protein n=1 Tax=Streptomyces chengmaiensis TaxID=3040919 RepID=A0ABT6HS90_9ACTN|nr:extracellular solute-binding protein [Streptomyces chengmaiensis]MDH2391575.1 extracellular solute-binding protein [Streptomyces chengmaiensis]